MVLVSNRKKIEAKKNYKEKWSHELSPFGLVDEVTNIAEHLFKKNCNSGAFCQSSIRDMFTFLFSHNGILRGESLFRAELSDICSLWLKDEGN